MREPGRLIAGALIIIVFLFGALEIGRWNKAELADILTPTQKARRIVGLVLLLTLGAMAYGGTYWPAPILVPTIIREVELLYWLFFALLTVFIPLIAFFEFKDSLRRGNQLRRETYREIVTAPLDELPSDDDATRKTLP